MKKNITTCTLKRHILPYLLTSALLLSTTGCGKKPSDNVNIENSKLSSNNIEVFENTSKPNSNFISTYSDFSLKLLKASCDDSIKSGKNVLISPESVSIAMAMAGNGADKNTKKEIYDVLGNGLDTESYNKMLSYTEQTLNDSEGYFNSSNSIWIRATNNQTKVSEDYIKDTKSYFNADSFYAPFNDTTLKELNSWVDKNTNHMIPTILDEFSPNSMVYLINAIAFNGKWKAGYNKQQIVEDTFTNGNGKTENCLMLTSTENAYIATKNATGVIKEYENDKYAFMAILPNEGISISQFLESFDGETFQTMYSEKFKTDVITRIPKFATEYEANLTSPLKSLGIKDAFNGKTADFSKMSKVSELYIGNVIHKTSITLDENGTKAAAATAVEMRTKSTETVSKDTKTVILNRPFIYAIIDTETGMPIFLGVVNSVE